MEKVPAEISGKGYEAQSGGGGSKLPENSSRITLTGLTALINSKRGDENYELGLRAGLGYCNALDPNLFLQIGELDLVPVIQSIAQQHEITGGSFKKFQEGFLGARALLNEKLKSVTNDHSSTPSSKLCLVGNRVEIADKASEIVGDALLKIKGTESGNRCYDLGVKAGWTFINQLNPLLLTYFELLETNSNTQSFSNKFNLEGEDLEKFEEGFSFFKGYIIEKLEEAKLLAPEDEKNGFIKRGEDIAKIYYEHPSNRNSLVELFLDRSKLIKVFYQVMQKENLYLKYARDILKFTDYKEIMAHSIDLAVHAECFSNAMSAFFKKNQQAIESIINGETQMSAVNGSQDWLAGAVTHAQITSPESGGGSKNPGRVTSVAIDTLKYNKKENFYYRKGHNAATIYMNQMDKALINSFIERLELDPVVRKIALENGITGSAFKMFKKGFTDLIVHLKEDLINEGLFLSGNLDFPQLMSCEGDSALEEYVLQRGAEVALRFYQDPSNLELLVKLFNKKFDISEVFYDYMKTTGLYLKYVDTIPNGGVGTIDVLNTVDFEASKKGFIREIDKFFKQDKDKFVALTKSPSQLADEIAAEPATLPKQKIESKPSNRGKKKKEASSEPVYSSITKEGLESLDSLKDDPNYKKGVAAAMKYFDQLTPAIIQKIETYNFSKVAEEKARKEGCKGKELMQFIKGFSDITESLKKQLKKDGVFDSTPYNLSDLETSSVSSAPSPEYFLEKGAELAKQFYEDAANRDALVLAYEDRSQLRKLFDEYAFRENFRLVYIPNVPQDQRDRYDIANSLSIGLCYNGFLQEIQRFFTKESSKFNALKLDIGALVDSIENPASAIAESVEGKKKKKKKKKKKSENSRESGPFVLPENAQNPILEAEAENNSIVNSSAPLNNNPDEKRAKHALKEKSRFSSIIEEIATDGVSDGAIVRLKEMIKKQSEKVAKMKRFYDALVEEDRKSLAKKVLDCAIDILIHFETEYKKVTPTVVEEEEKPATASKASAESSVSASSTNPLVEGSEKPSETEYKEVTPTVVEKEEKPAAASKASAESSVSASSTNPLVEGSKKPSETEYKEVTPTVVKKEEKPAAASKASAESSVAASSKNVGGAFRNVQQYHALSSSYNENGQFSVKIHTIVKTVLILQNKDGIPIKLSGYFTELQMQTLKVSLIYMIKNGVFNDRAGAISLEGIVADLNRAIPDNKHTLGVYNQLNINQWSYFQQYHDNLSPYHNALSVLQAAGFRFSI